MTTEANTDPAGSAAESAAFDPLSVELEHFSGPLDLLLHLIREHQMDIFNIPVATITEKYLKYMEIIQELNLDRAGDFLVMAATLAHIKSRMLLPPEELEEEPTDEEEGKDPREALVRRLLEYQKYRDASIKLATRPMLDRDVFTRPPDREIALPPDEVDIEDVSVFKLIEVFQQILDRVRQHAPHKVEVDRVSVEDRIALVLSRLRQDRRIAFQDLFAHIVTRAELVATFLAILELARLKVTRLYQTGADGGIYISLRPDAPDDDTILNRVTLKSMTDGASEPADTNSDL